MAALARRSKGFTLIEILIAVVVTAAVGLGAWGALNIAITTNEATQKSTADLKKLQRAMLMLSRDLQQIAPRPIRNEYGDLDPALKTGGGFYDVEFTKRGWRNPMEDPRSELQRIAYQLEDGELKRYSWSALDREQDIEPTSRLLLDGIEKLEFKFKGEKKWIESWPPENNGGGEDEEETEINKKSVIPSGVSLLLVHESFGEIPRIFEITGFMPNAKFSDSDLAGGEGGDGGDGGGSDEEEEGE